MDSDRPASPEPQFLLRLASGPEDLRAAQRLRYEVFVEELGGDGPLVDHAARLERDEFDEVCDHLLLIDEARQVDGRGTVAAVYRLMRDDQARSFGRFYSEAEYDLSPLKASGKRLLELGRSCVGRDWRGGPAMLLVWNALGDYVLDHGIEVLFGMASFHGTDPAPLAEPLSWLHAHHLAPESMRVRARPRHFQRMDLLAPDGLDRGRALAAMPALIRGYLRLGGTVGEGAWIDEAFNTTDICLILDTARMSARHRDFYTRKHAAGDPPPAGAA